MKWWRTLRPTNIWNMVRMGEIFFPKRNNICRIFSSFQLLLLLLLLLLFRYPWRCHVRNQVGHDQADTRGRQDRHIGRGTAGVESVTDVWVCALRRLYRRPFSAEYQRRKEADFFLSLFIALFVYLFICWLVYITLHHTYGHLANWQISFHSKALVQLNFSSLPTADIDIFQFLNKLYLFVLLLLLLILYTFSFAFDHPVQLCIELFVCLFFYSLTRSDLLLLYSTTAAWSAWSKNRTYWKRRTATTLIRRSSTTTSKKRYASSSRRWTHWTPVRSGFPCRGYTSRSGMERKRNIRRQKKKEKWNHQCLETNINDNLVYWMQVLTKCEE